MHLAKATAIGAKALARTAMLGTSLLLFSEAAATDLAVARNAAPTHPGDGPVAQEGRSRSAPRSSDAGPEGRP